MDKHWLRPHLPGALAFWAGSDHYPFFDALRRRPFPLPLDRVTRVYHFRSWKNLDFYGIEYYSESRECFVTLRKLPTPLQARQKVLVSPASALPLLLNHSWREPTALVLPFVLPFFLMLMLSFLGIWDDYVLQDQAVLNFFANPGCNAVCVGKVLRIHTLVGFLFLAQLCFLFLPLYLLLQAPRYQRALNYRMIQSYSAVSAFVGLIIFVQLMAFFPFRQYGQFVSLGFTAKVERILSHLDEKK